jgi:hypothetical protein
VRLGTLCGLLLAGGFVAVACTDEDPTGVGGDLPLGGTIRTYELILGPEVFLASDTSVAGFFKPSGSSFVVLSGGADGLTSHVLVRFAAPPSSVIYRDTMGVSREDTLPTYIGADLVLWVDTLRSTASGPVELQLYRIGEEWDPRSATWAERVDSGNVRLSWSEPGGTRAGLVAVGLWEPDAGDSVVIAVDSQTVALWGDTTDATRGALIALPSPDVRLVSLRPILRLHARPSARPDTVVDVTVSAVGATFVFDPQPGATADLRIGGLPTWRSYLEFQRLDTLTLPCPGEDPAAGCVLPLREVKINYAALQLRPTGLLSAFVPGDSLVIAARPVLVKPSVPVDRAPLGGNVAARSSNAIPPERFRPGGGGEDGAIEVPVTWFVEALATGPDDAPSSVLALFATREGQDFGFGTFGGQAAGEAAPRLRLIVSTASRVEIR